MAKSARASTKKSNNAKLKSRVFGPIENARTERLSAKLLELASQPRPPRSEELSGDVVMEATDAAAAAAKKNEEQTDMEIDHAATATPSKSTDRKGRIEKRRSGRSRASIVFPKFKDGKRVGIKRKR